MLQSLVYQLLESCIDITPSLDSIFSSCADGLRPPSVHGLLSVLEQMIRGFSQVYVVLDALDECAQRADLLEILETIAKWKLENLHLLFTSRREQDIETILSDIVDQGNWVSLQDAIVDADIQKYIRQRLSQDKSLQKWARDAALGQEIETALMLKSRGMFRWAACQLDALSNCRNRSFLRKALATLPLTLDETYGRILSSIKEEDSECAIRILRWLTFSVRPLAIEEVAELAAINVEHDPAFDRDDVLEDPLEVMNICSSLVTITVDEQRSWLFSETTERRQCVALAHYSVKAYLLSERIWKTNVAQYGMRDTMSHDIIARGCLGYLLQLQDPKLDPDNFFALYRLARYSAEFWISHAYNTGDFIKNTNAVAIRLFSPENPAFINWVRLYNLDKPWVESELKMSREDIPHPLYYAALSGLEEIVNSLLEKGFNPNMASIGIHGTPLNAATYKGHVQIVELLLDSDADPNFGDDSPLRTAVVHGYERIVELLLNGGADPSDGKPLFVAVSGHHEQIVNLLLGHGAGPSVQIDYYESAIYISSEEGQEQIVRLLLAKGADPNVEGGDYGNALQAASFRGHYEIVKLLLENSADMDPKLGAYGNALEAASMRGHKDVIKLLRNKGAKLLSEQDEAADN